MKNLVPRKLGKLREGSLGAVEQLDPRVARETAPVALSVDERIAQREILHHAHDRIVDRHVAVRVILAEHVADDRGGLLVRATRHQSQLVHRVQHASMHGLQSIAHVGQRTRDNDAHRVVDERFFDLVVDEPREDPLSVVWCGHDSVSREQRGRSKSVRRARRSRGSGHISHRRPPRRNPEKYPISTGDATGAVSPNLL